MRHGHDYIDTKGSALCWELIRRGVLTHDAIPDRTHQSLVVRYDVVQEMADAYGYTEERKPRFVPTPRDVSNMMSVWYWLNDLRKQIGTGKRDFKLLVSRARGVPWWKLAQRWGKCEKTIQRWHDGAVALIYLANRDEVLKLGDAGPVYYQLTPCPKSRKLVASL
jgi:hypothetical protein